ncbi:hypothetical protein [Pectobacterium parmentieri]|uniref:hypothetical protein n=1 Tax=Pectobacterium parmentieri TaxID=1905730 RepID=UPI0018E16B22|nr:hypothetical protein [Pectobacterium parmentieri]QQA75498.1 hypothetical protein JBL47_19615 [Pectobacterium parmentieri]
MERGLRLTPSGDHKHFRSLQGRTRSVVCGKSASLWKQISPGSLNAIASVVMKVRFDYFTSSPTLPWAYYTQPESGFHTVGDWP